MGLRALSAAKTAPSLQGVAQLQPFLRAGQAPPQPARRRIARRAFPTAAVVSLPSMQRALRPLSGQSNARGLLLAPRLQLPTLEPATGANNRASSA